jgi:uncharacterized phage protein gp47/JayE
VAGDPILQNTIVQPGQSQGERLPRELDVHFADVDERMPDVLLAYARALTAKVPFVKPAGPGPEPARVSNAGGWKPFFEAPVAGQERGSAQALYDTFLHLYDQGPRRAINRLTEGHLDFLYQQVLGFRRDPAVPDRAHAILTLKKGSLPVQVLPAHRFSAGKDAAGVEQFYAPTTDVIVNTSQIASLRSIYVDPRPNGKVHLAPVANSADGLGRELTEDAPGWKPFGHAGLQIANVGFALASPVLLMQEGKRIITVTLALAAATTLTTGHVKDAFQGFLTGGKQWLGPISIAAKVVAAGELELTIELDETLPAVVRYDPGVHAHGFSTDAPVLQVLLKADAPVAYNELSALKVGTASIKVDVSNFSAVTLESDAGTLDPKKAFLPFGPLPAAGSRLMIGCDEALSKTLSDLDLTLEWKGAPAKMHSHYTGYKYAPGNAAFTVEATFRDRTSAHTSTEGLFSDDAAEKKTIKLLSSADTPPAFFFDLGFYVYALSLIATSWAQLQVGQQVSTHRVAHSFQQQPPESRPGVITLKLERDFQHMAFRQESVAKIIEKLTADKPDEVTLLNEPYTPALQRLTLAYKAHTAVVNVSSTAKEDFANLDVQFFHVGPFGERRDHGHQRQLLGFVDDTHVPLVQPYPHQGELLIGLSGLKAGDSVSLLFQVAEGSANPDVTVQRPDWAVLCDNYWKPLGAEGVVRDTTNLLLRSGVVGVVIPTEATTTNTLLDPGLIWLKASVPLNADATSLLIDAVANAVEVQWVMGAADGAGAHLATALPPGSIAKLATPIASVSKVKQPYASFGGRTRESGDALRTRAAERLRHKDRAITQWDYERLVLGAFPSVHRVKCIPHASTTSWMAPGHVMVVVVPDLRNRNAPDPLQPKVDADTLLRIKEFLVARAPGPVSIFVKNPFYQHLRVSCLVRFHTGREFNFHRAATVEALIRALSPWAFDQDTPLRFGGRVYASTLLNFIEELPYVDYVTDFQLLTDDENGTFMPVEHADPRTPDAILVSDKRHDIGEVKP